MLVALQAARLFRRLSPGAREITFDYNWQSAGGWKCGPQILQMTKVASANLPDGRLASVNRGYRPRPPDTSCIPNPEGAPSKLRLGGDVRSSQTRTQE